VVDIFDGVFARGSQIIVQALGDSVINLYGGVWQPRRPQPAESLPQIVGEDRSTVNVFGVGLSLTDAGQGIQQLQGTLSDGAPIDLRVSGNIVVHEVVPLQSGDANQDLSFDQLDIVQVLQGAKYLTGEPATWRQGDWNGAPGGMPGTPPPGDGIFDQLDIVAALDAGVYLTGPYAQLPQNNAGGAMAALAPGGTRNDGQTSLLYDAATGELQVDAPVGTELTSINIDSAAGIFTGQAALNLGGSFDNDADINVFKATFGSSFGSLSFGNVSQPGLTEEFLVNDLTVIGSLQDGGALGDVDLVYIPIPEPGALPLAAIAVVLSLVLGFVSKSPSLCLSPPQGRGREDQ
jgi:hypothetical protein